MNETIRDAIKAIGLESDQLATIADHAALSDVLDTLCWYIRERGSALVMAREGRPDAVARHNKLADRRFDELPAEVQW